MEELLERHLPGLDAFVSRKLGPLVRQKESASDLLQSTCREVLQHVDRFQYDGEEGFRRWLYTTALRKIKNRQRYYRAERRDAAREAPAEGRASALPADRLAQLAAQLTSVSGVAMQKEHLERVTSALLGLPERAREVVTLVYFEQRSREEVAEKLGLTPAHARMVLARALARLAKTLREGEDQ